MAKTILPAQTGASGKYLKSDGTDATWESVTPTAANTSYDNSTSGLTATDTQAAVDEVVTQLSAIDAQLAQITNVNVKSFGAVGDGTTDDRTAIIAAFAYAIAHLPAEVYFPVGDYGILTGGIYLTLPLGSGGLRVRGAGANLSRIKYLTNWYSITSWVALRIEPVSTPTIDAEYLHDITLQDIGVIDADPTAHDLDGVEETHGFSVKYCNNFIMKNCGIWSVGDEAIEINFCKNSLIDGNYFYNSPGAGAGGGSISIAAGCNKVTVSNNFVDGTVVGKINSGIQLETVDNSTLENIIITNNHIQNIAGYGIKIVTAANTISNVMMAQNTIKDCTNAVEISGSLAITNILINGLQVKTCAKAINAGAANLTKLIIDKLYADTISDTCIYLASGNMSKISNSILTALQKAAIWFAADNLTIDGVLIDGSGLNTTTTTGTIQQFTGKVGSVVRNTKILNCQSRYALQDIERVENVSVSMIEASPNVAIVNPKFVTGGIINGIIKGVKASAVINGVSIYMVSNPGQDGVILDGVTNCIVVGCNITVPGRYGIRELNAADYNIIANNNVRATTSGIAVLGGNTVSVNNLVP